MWFEKHYRYLVRWGYIIGIFLLMISLPNSKWGMAFSQFWLAFAFVFERFDLKKVRNFLGENNRFRAIVLFMPKCLSLIVESIYKGVKTFWRNKPAVIFSSILLMHLIGLTYTTDFDYGFKDLRTKLPLFLLPLYISTSQAFSRKDFYRLILLFCAAVLVRTLINSWSLFQDNYIDIRDISKAISHQRLALLISISIFTLGYLTLKKRYFNIYVKSLFVVVIVWFLIYLIITSSATGIIITGATITIMLLVKAFKEKNWYLKFALFGTITALVLASGLYVNGIVREFYKVKQTDISHLDPTTSRGNKYQYTKDDYRTENGYYISIYVQPEELHQAWAKRSKMSLDSTDKKGQNLYITLLRFLTSKGERKDGDAVDRLTTKEIMSIEKGIANVIFIDEYGIKGRIYEFLFGFECYKLTGNPSGSTVMQRYEHIKASLLLIKANPLIGVGTGDMNIAFKEQYEKMKTRLEPSQRLRSHDQYLSITVGFGIIGLIWFLFAILYPVIKLGRFNDFFFFVFFVVAMLSMTAEDTIESQAGVTFFAFFYTFLLWGKKEEDIL